MSSETSAPQLRLERRSDENLEQHAVRIGDTTLLLTPPLNEDFWEYRVVVGEHQAIVGFPKFGTIGVGFAVEEDWNTNLPYRCKLETIWDHIKRNKGDDRIPDEWCIEAIRLIREAAFADHGGEELDL